MNIKFKNTDKYYSIPLDIIEKYPKSFFKSHMHFNNVSECIIENYTYEEFEVVYKYMIDGNLLDYTNNMEILDYFGVGNEQDVNIYEALTANLTKKINLLNKFMNFKNITSPVVNDKGVSILPNHNSILFVDSVEDYITYKNGFKNNKNIIPIQIITQSSEINLIMLGDGIPVYYNFETYHASIETGYYDFKEFSNKISLQELQNNIISSNLQKMYHSTCIYENKGNNEIEFCINVMGLLLQHHEDENSRPYSTRYSYNTEFILESYEEDLKDFKNDLSKHIDIKEICNIIELLKKNDFIEHISRQLEDNKRTLNDSVCGSSGGTRDERTYCWNKNYEIHFGFVNIQ